MITAFRQIESNLDYQFQQFKERLKFEPELLARARGHTRQAFQVRSVHLPVEFNSLKKALATKGNSLSNWTCEISIEIHMVHLILRTREALRSFTRPLDRRSRSSARVTNLRSDQQPVGLTCTKSKSNLNVQLPERPTVIWMWRPLNLASPLWAISVAFEFAFFERLK